MHRNYLKQKFETQSILTSSVNYENKKFLTEMRPEIGPSCMNGVSFYTQSLFCLLLTYNTTFSQIKRFQNIHNISLYLKNVYPNRNLLVEVLFT